MIQFLRKASDSEQRRKQLIQKISCSESDDFQLYQVAVALSVLMGIVSFLSGLKCGKQFENRAWDGRNIYLPDIFCRKKACFAGLHDGRPFETL